MFFYIRSQVLDFWRGWKIRRKRFSRCLLSFHVFFQDNCVSTSIHEKWKENCENCKDMCRAKRVATIRTFGFRTKHWKLNFSVVMERFVLMKGRLLTTKQKNRLLSHGSISATQKQSHAKLQQADWNEPLTGKIVSNVHWLLKLFAFHFFFPKNFFLHLQLSSRIFSVSNDGIWWILELVYIQDFWQEEISSWKY